MMNHRPRPEDCLAGGGDMGALMRSKNWTDTPLGPVSTWPQSLRTAVSMMLDSAFAMVIAWGPEFIFLYNDRYRPVLGATKHPGALGRPSQDIFPEAWDYIGPLFEKTRTGDKVALDDMLIPLDRNGYLEDCYFTLSYSPIRDESGGVGGMLAVVAETTVRVQGERRLATLRDLAALAKSRSADDACLQAERVLAANPSDVPFSLLYLVDDDGRHARLAGVSGLERGSPAAPPLVALDDPAGWCLSECHTTRAPLVVSDLPARFGRLTGGPYEEPAHTALVLPIMRAGHDQPYGFFVAGVSPRRALDDRYRTFFELARDHIVAAINNALAYEEERKRAEALAEIDRAKTAFFSNVSHEFRTPLTLLLGPIEDLLSGARGTLPEAARDDLQAMQRNTQRLLKLVNTLLDFARTEAGRLQASYEPIDLAALTAELAGVFRSAIERAGLRLTVECPPLPEPIHVDREMWEKIVLNLLSNAFKFTFDGEIAVSLQQKGDLVELEVRDSGTGIPKDELPNLFKRFHRVQGAKSRSHEGTGIGLALVQDLVRLHGGDITVDSAPGRGSSFKATVRTGTAHLPPDRLRAARTLASSTVRPSSFVDEALRWLPSQRAATPSAEPAEPRGLSSAALSTVGARILIADDNTDMRDYLRRLLAPYWTVQEVADGAAALAEAQRDPPELVISDVMMPGLDGFALLRSLRSDARTRQVPVVMLSARAGEEARIEGLDAGADDYLTKPFIARELVARVASQLVLARGRQALEQQRATLYSHFMQAPTPICILRGPRHVIELANPRCCEVWRRPHQDVIDRPLFEALPEIESQPFKDLLENVLRTGEPCLGKETPALLGPDTPLRTVYFNFVYAPLRDLQGKIDGVLVLAFDVTDEVRARDELARTVRYNEMFAGILAHDLRNPLGAVLTAAQLLLMRHGGDTKLAMPAQRIFSSAERMARMIEQLLDFTRIRLAGGLGIERRAVDLRELLHATLSETEAASPGWSVRLESMGQASGWWDGDRLAQVISNLAGNAAQHGAAGTPAQVRLDGRDPDRVTLIFENKGVIPPDELSRLFDPFRATQHRRDKAKGLGLGLFITREIVVAHGGEVEVASTEEQGTRFTIVLPRGRSAP
jgi:signal transduction histidine kinase/CheY-like chemotaxis protein